MKANFIIIVCMLLVCLGPWPAYPLGDPDTFMVRTDPNILIIFDNSGSMRTIIFHSGYNPATVYTGNIQDSAGKIPGQSGYDPTDYKEVTSSGAYDPGDFTSGAGGSPDVYLRGGDADLLSSGTDYIRYPVNYLNWIFFHASSGERSALPDDTRIEVAKNVVRNYITNASNVRLGLMRFNYDATDGGGTIVRAIDDISESFKTTLTSSLDGIAPDTNTPLGGSLSEAWRYFRGDSKCYGGSGNYQSPIEYRCQKNFVVIMTDGEPWSDRMSSSCASSMRANWDGDSETEQPVNDVSHYYSYRYLDDVAYYMYNNDARSNLDEKQNVYTYTIGFTIQSQLLQDTAANGHGLYLMSDNASQLAAALEAAIADIIEKSYSFTSPTVPSLMASGDNVLYQASFEPSDGAFWKGHLYAHTIDSGGTITGTLWDAGAILRNRAAATRVIYTVKGGMKVEFNTAAITAADLGVPDNAERDKLVDYVRGVDSYDDDGDGNTTEERSWKLGDVFHSGPVIAGAPKKFYFDYGYSGPGEFYDQHKDRTKIILVGANDGMVHAFRASDGSEAWAFIPPNLLSKLKNMRTGHSYYVDLSVRVEDVWSGSGDGTGKIATSKTPSEWHTLAIIGERQGGNQFNCLEITSTTSPQWRWSLNTSGETWGRPAINRVNLNGNEKWVAVVGGGYDSAGLNGRDFHIVDAYSGAAVWSCSTDHTAPAPPCAIDMDFDGFIDRIYLGDLSGDMYRFCVHDSSAGNWSASLLYDAPSGQIRPIFTEAVGAFDSMNNLWIYFGTGDKSDPTAANSQEQFYAIREGCPFDAGSCPSYSFGDLSNYTTQSGETSDQGWYITLGGQGEKVLSAPTVFGGTVYFTTYTPSQSNDPCEGGGSGTIYAVDYLTAEGRAAGGRTSSLDQGVPSAPMVSVKRDDLTGQLSGSVFVNTSSGGLQKANVNPSIPSSLVDYIYWRDLRMR